MTEVIVLNYIVVVNREQTVRIHEPLTENFSSQLLEKFPIQSQVFRVIGTGPLAAFGIPSQPFFEVFFLERMLFDWNIQTHVFIDELP